MNPREGVWNEDHIVEKGFNSISQYNMVHTFIPMHQAMQTLDAKVAVDKEWEKLEKLPAWQLDQVKSKKRGHSRGTKIEKNNSPLSYTDGHLSSQKCRVRTEVSKV